MYIRTNIHGYRLIKYLKKNIYIYIQKNIKSFFNFFLECVYIWHFIREYVTSRYQLVVLLNSINDTHDMMSNVIEHIGIISLLSFKATIKRYLNNKYSYFCSIINCYICKQYH